MLLANLLLLLILVQINIHELPILLVLRTQRVLHFHLFKSAEHTFAKVHFIAYVVHCFERRKVTVAPVTQDHAVPQCELLALLLDLIDQATLLDDPMLELFKHFTHKVVVQVNLLLDLLHVNRL
jgi:uncharacterized protein YpbB